MRNDVHTYATYKPCSIPRIREVPAHWAVKRLAQIGTFSKGGGGTKDDEVDHGLPCVRYGDIYTSHKYFVTHSRSRINPDRTPDYARMKYGDALFAGSGETIEEIGKSVVSLIEGEAYCGGDVILFRPTVQAHPRFMGYALDSPPAAFQKSSMGRGITIMHVYSSQLKNMCIPFPPLEEQAAIVRYLDHADDCINRYITAKERLIALLQEERQAVIHETVTRGLDPNVALGPTKIKWLGQIPKHWALRRLGQLATKFGSGVTPRGGATVYQEAGIPILRSQNVHFDGLRLSDVARISPNLHQELSSSHVRPRDVLLNITGASIGRVCSVPEDFAEANVNQHVCIIRPNQDHLVSRFLVAFLSTPGAQSEIRVEQTGASREGLTLQSIRDFRIPLPPVPEQQNIISDIDKTTDKVYQAISAARRQISLMNEYRTRLIADVVTGQLDVRDDAVELPD